VVAHNNTVIIIPEIKDEKLLNSKHTTIELKESLKDIKVCGKKEIK